MIRRTPILRKKKSDGPRWTPQSAFEHVEPKKKKCRRIPTIRKERAAERRMYNKDRDEYLKAHPYCQIFIAQNRLNEEEVISAEGFLRGLCIPLATQIHHRNKTNGPRLLDKRWWMSACHEEHQYVENHKEESRKIGLLLPIQADAQGKWGAGCQALVTRDLLAVRARGGIK